MKKLFLVTCLLVSSLAFADWSADLQGNWATDCMWGGKYVMSFSEGSSVFKSEAFNDGDCANAAFTYQMKFTTAFPNAIDQTTQATDLTVDAVTVTIHDEAIAKQLSENNYCGRTWDPGVEIDITGLVCNETESFPAKGTIYYTAINVAEGKMTMAPWADAMDQRSTPSEWDPIFNKQQ
ncbi:MAG: hypothetical protein AB7F43_08660 [Bacteriovoracia bacterium]